MILDYKQLAVACHFGSASKTDIESFIRATSENGTDFDSRLFDAYQTDITVARTRMLDFISISYPEFQLLSEAGLIACRAELKRQIDLLLASEISPANFCTFFNSMELELVVNSDLPTDAVEFLGNLYHACDWCDESWTLANSVYLVEEAERMRDRF